jgi:hypothetical protein
MKAGHGAAVDSGQRRGRDALGIGHDIDRLAGKTGRTIRDVLVPQPLAPRLTDARVRLWKPVAHASASSETLEA